MTRQGDPSAAAPSLAAVPETPACPACRSTLLHPQRLRPGDAPETTVDLRCAECSEWTHGTYAPSELAELDRERLAGRLALVQAYELCVSQSMERFADSFGDALRRDLLGPDDFAPHRTR
ncbi:MAG: hypothetical protein AVDCRST_MAG69-325 [uncultured Solirubrobacteraceae bacterium]|uniref:Uncharacterized protein n=1 Tax=uncultured Solirubrobacteraceae bacterium TaxID=1162706 RepID=A0A6J4RIS4_9ACTN|nr:MAG: hypothetical protein AVDCRST_MAG69-325 [uncultured Solirubrobacteraceae bacterium]